MPPDFPQRPDVLNHDAIPAWILLAAGLGAALIWLLAHRLRRRAPALASGVRGLPFFAVRALLAGTILWTALQTLGRLLVLETPWPLAGLALGGGVVIELLIGLYRHERRLIAPRLARLLLLLRLGAAGVILLILAQPVYSRIRSREIAREVVVLVDDSASMQLADKDQPLPSRLAIARLFNPALFANKPDLAPVMDALNALLAKLSQQVESLKRVQETSPELATQRMQQFQTGLPPFLDEARKEAAEIAQSLRGAAASQREFSPSQRSLSAVASRLADELPRHLDQLTQAATGPQSAALTGPLQAARDLIADAVRALPPLARQIDEEFTANLTPAQRQEIDRFATLPRSEIARQALLARDSTGLTLAEALRQRYTLRFLRFGKEPLELPPDPWLTGESLPAPEDHPDFRRETDLSAALEDAIARVPAESLAGVLVLSDGRHNAEVPVEDAARQLAAQGSALCAIAVGSRIGPRDASILNLSAPQSIYLGDRLAIRADLKLDGLRGRQVTARLTSGETVLQEQVVEVPEDQYRTSIRFTHTPPEKGIFDYKVVLAPVEGELFDNNNTWEFKAAVSDDRTNVLLVDSFPRWEFRYLRNLFYGRDKSVHLQYVLLQPDAIRGSPNTARIPASASRPFGQAEATALPLNEAEWRKFDAVIFGDLPPAALDSPTWRILRDCVAERGTMLVFVAGPRYLPHAFTNDTARDLFPINYLPSSSTVTTPDQYRLELTAAGESSPLLQQSLSHTINRQIWGSIPDLAWRVKPDSIKPGAEVLAYARPAAAGANKAALAPGFAGNPAEVEAALERLAHQKEFEQDNALLTTMRYGIGHVVMLTFDSTWRFRYGVGDTYHHRFWGQLLRWGTGTNLRSGGDFARLGTDQLSYSPRAPIRITAKILGREREPFTGTGVSVALYRGAQRLQHRPLTYQPGSNGMFEGELAPLAVEGNYRLVLEGEPAQKAAQLSGLDSVETELRVVTTHDSLELSELTADPDFLASTASLTRGSLAPLSNPHAVLPAFGAPKETLQERHDYHLWDTFPLLLLFLSLLTLEWLLRRGAGLP